MLEIVILSIIQGVTEFLPVSSSSHLIIISNFSNFQNQGLAIDVSLHIGSFLAVVVFFKDEIINFIKNKTLFLKIFVASIPVMVLGYTLIKLNLIEYLRNIKVIGWTTLIFGILLYFSDKCSQQKSLKKDLSFKLIFIVGLIQALSLVPGVSRSGVTITGARFLKYNRLDSAKISFLLSIPTLAAVSVFGIRNLITAENFEVSYVNLLCIFLSFVCSFLTIKFFLYYVQKFSLILFVSYRMILGVILLAISYS